MWLLLHGGLPRHQSYGCLRQPRRSHARTGGLERSQMKLTSTKQRRAVAAAITAVGVVLALFANEPAGLLVGVAAASICCGWQMGLGAIAVGTGLLTASI